MRLVGPSGIVIDVPDGLGRALLRDPDVRVVERPRRRPVSGPAPDGPAVAEATPETLSEPDGYPCGECGAVFSSARGRSAHMRRHR